MIPLHPQGIAAHTYLCEDQTLRPPPLQKHSPSGFFPAFEKEGAGASKDWVLR